MTEFSSVIATLSVVLMLSLAVERFIEITRHLFDLFLGMKGTRKLPKPNEVAQSIDTLSNKLEADKQRLEAETRAEAQDSERQKNLAVLRSNGDTPPNVSAELKSAESETEWDERYTPALVLSVPASDPDTTQSLKVFTLQLVAFATGIILARIFEVQLFTTLLENYSISIAKPTDYILTGLLIGGGSKPIHLLIRFVTQRKVRVPKVHKVAEEEQKILEEVEAKPATVPAPASASTSEPAHDWVDIDYHGGVDREILETVHKRLANPEMIIYHHTAMNSKSSFEDVVSVIKNKNWVTGYNCVIMQDGSIKPFCRWDRFGNHAVGYNRKSLGLSFNGNFETNPSTPFSNPDGRAGIQRPTEEQLKSGARVIALWSFLYNIPEDFDKKIIPHNKISSKGCPGNNFPYEEFKKWISYYRKTWSNSAFAKSRIEEFKLKPYVYI